MAQLVRTLDVQDREQFHLVKSIANNMFDDEVIVLMVISSYFCHHKLSMIDCNFLR